MKKRSQGITLDDARAHAAHHGYALEVHRVIPPASAPSDDSTGILARPVKMTRPEREYGLILEAMKRHGDVVDYRFQGMSLAWGADPETGRLMRYKCDWLVIDAVREEPRMSVKLMASVKLIEVKGAHIWPKDLIRFKGCRAEWPMFKFEMHQLIKGEWRRIH